MEPSFVGVPVRSGDLAFARMDGLWGQVAEAAQQRLQREARGTGEQEEGDERWRERMEEAVSDALAEAELDDRRVTQVREFSCSCRRECAQGLPQGALS
jgi:hypothetical protein